MHKFIYPSKDTYINNSANYIDKNFGNDEVLEIYASNQGKKTIYTTLNWLPIPETSQSYGYEGAMAYSTSSVYIYSDSLWRQFSISNDIINSSSYISNFTGKFTNVQTSPYVQLYLDGTSTHACGSFSGSYVFNSISYVNGLFTSGSFSGSVDENSTFSNLIVNGIEYTTSPLTSSLTGT